MHGERLTLGIVELEPNLAVPEHKHENEQVGFVLQGRVTMVIGGEARTHSASTGPEGATVVEVFNPVRADWEGLDRLEARPGNWPD